MAIVLDTILIVDVECTCWEGDTSPPGQSSEIIEIGLCGLDAHSLKRLWKESILVKPVHSKVSPFCTQLTSITEEMVEKGKTLREASYIMRKSFKSRDRYWASWNDYDQRQLKRCCSEQHVAYPMSRAYLNIRSIMELAVGARLSLAEAYDIMKVETEGTLHRGADDAWNEAKLLSLLLSRFRETPLGESILAAQE